MHLPGKCGSRASVRKRDVLDTPWFSSALYCVLHARLADKTRLGFFLRDLCHNLPAATLSLYRLPHDLLSAWSTWGETRSRRLYSRSGARCTGRKMSSRSAWHPHDPLRDSSTSTARMRTFCLASSPETICVSRMRARTGVPQPAIDLERIHFRPDELTIDQGQGCRAAGRPRHRGQVDHQQVQHAGCRRYPQHRPV